MLKIDVHATRAVLRAQEPLTVGLVGALVHFVFDDLWKNLSRIAVFRQGNVTKDAVVTGDFVAIPREVLQQPWLPLEIGVYGTDARGKRVIPTVWVRTDPVQSAAEPVDDPGLEPTAAVWQQVLGSMGNLDALDTENRTDLVSAINEANRAVCLVTVTPVEGGRWKTDKTLEEINTALLAGKHVDCYVPTHSLYLPCGAWDSVGFSFRAVKNNVEHVVQLRTLADGSTQAEMGAVTLATEQHKLPNPQKLTFKGAVEAEYDGSQPLTVELPGTFWVRVANNGDGTYSADRTHSEILAAHQAGQAVWCKFGNLIYPLTTAMSLVCNFGGIDYATGVWRQLTVGHDGKVKVTTRAVGSSGTGDPGTGTPGKDGGYYTPEITQPEAGKMQIDWTASQDDMSAVAPVSIELPSGPPGVPDAVVTETSRVVNTALTHEDSRILRFIALADAHQKNEGALSTEITEGTKELGQAVGEVLRQIGVDFVANLGDTTWGSSNSDSATCLEEAKMFNKLVTDSLRGETQICTEGNHETDKLTDSQIYALIYSHNKGYIQDADHWIEGYGYMDFPNQKVRVICLNTNQGESGNVSGMSNEQLKWFAETALDMSGKADWNVITMGHHPLSYNTVSLMKYAVSIVETFIEGNNLDLKDNSDAKITNVNYDGKNCQYVGHFHGHAHAYSIVRMQKYVSTNNYQEIDAWEICIPNACYTRNNQYLNNTANPYVERYSTPETYNKTNEDGNRTAFNIVTVCLDAKIIYADNYGAGIDRVVSYDFDTISYTITRNLTNCTSSRSTLSAVRGMAHTETLTAADGYTMDGASVNVTMGGVDITSFYSNGVLNIASVTGDIVITASAVVAAPVIVNLLDVNERTYVAMSEPQFVEPEHAHEMDYTKCYAGYVTGRRGQYPTSKITYTQNKDINGFTFQASSTSGYGIEFPVLLESGKEYEFRATSTGGRFPYVSLLKYNADRTIADTEVIQKEAAGDDFTKIKSITPESGYLYSILFYTTTANTNLVMKDVSLMEKV